MGAIYLYGWYSRYAPSQLYEGIICGIEKSIISISIGIWEEHEPSGKKLHFFTSMRTERFSGLTKNFELLSCLLILHWTRRRGQALPPGDERGLLLPTDFREPFSVPHSCRVYPGIGLNCLFYVQGHRVG